MNWFSFCAGVITCYLLSGTILAIGFSVYAHREEHVWRMGDFFRMMFLYPIVFLMGSL